jgi:hypothetical protein
VSATINVSAEELARRPVAGKATGDPITRTCALCGNPFQPYNRAKRYAHCSFACRFWSRVDRRGPNECWEWTLGRDEAGYGTLTVGRRRVRAHRVAWEIARGAIAARDDGEVTCVLHTCDNPPCCNPAHHFLGTRDDNAADRDAKGRNVVRVGEAHANARVTEADVLEIRALASAGETRAALGQRFGISPWTVGAIVQRRRWRHVGIAAAAIEAIEEKHAINGARRNP